MRYWLPLFVVLTLLGSGSVLAQESESFRRAEAKPEEFVVGTILHNPPYVTEHPSSGIDLDIIRAAMAQSGTKVRFVHAPIARVEKLLENGLVDAITTFATIDGLCENSDVFSEWHDGIIVPRDSRFDVRAVSDLAGLKVGMFPGAEQVLASTLDPYAASFGGKVTIFSAPLVLRMLRYQRIDAYIGDFWSIEYAQKNDLEFKNQPRLFDVAVKFDPTPRSLCIRDKQHLALFNEGLAAAKMTGSVSEILAQYRVFIPD